MELLRYKNEEVAKIFMAAVREAQKKGEHENKIAVAGNGTVRFDSQLGAKRESNNVDYRKYTIFCNEKGLPEKQLASMDINTSLDCAMDNVFIACRDDLGYGVNDFITNPLNEQQVLRHAIGTMSETQRLKLEYVLNELNNNNNTELAICTRKYILRQMSRHALKYDPQQVTKRVHDVINGECHISGISFYK